MNKVEYMTSLKKKLRHLPQEDLRKALEYFEEYFEDAGVANELQAIEDLGTPEIAAEQLITNLAISNTQEPVKNIKKGMNHIWIGILSIFAAPIALPIAAVLALSILLIIFAIFLVIFVLFLAGFAGIIICPIYIIISFTQIGSGIGSFLNLLGMGIFTGGFGLITLIGAIKAFKASMNKSIGLFGKIAKKGGKSNDKK